MNQREKIIAILVSIAIVMAITVIFPYIMSTRIYDKAHT